MSLITISGLSKSFGEVVAVDTVTMEIAEGSFTSFLGPSGCGKTTMLRMIAGLEEPDEGEIRELEYHATQAARQARQGEHQQRSGDASPGMVAVAPAHRASSYTVMSGSSSTVRAW